MTPDDPMQTLFRCEHWACTLTHRACLRRQTETKWIAQKREARPIYERCGSGECEQGNAVGAQHPEFTRETQHTKKAPRLDIVQAVEERTMPRGKRDQPWPCCGSHSHRHMKGCTKAGKLVAATKPTPERLSRIVEAANKRAAKATKFRMETAPALTKDMSVTELLDLRAQVTAELARRENELETMLDQIRSATKSEAA